MIIELIKTTALLLSLCLLQSFAVRFISKNELAKQVVSGGIFGGVCIIGMMLPIEITPGVIFDPRTVVLSMAGLFGGPIVSVIAAALTGVYRLFLGGGGVYVGVAVVIASTCLGLGYRYCVHKGWMKVNIVQLLLFGLLVHVVTVLLFTQLPADVVGRVMSTIAFPFILIFTPATAFLGMLLKDAEDRFNTEQALSKTLDDFDRNVIFSKTDLTGKITHASKAFCEISGFELTELVGQPHKIVRHPDTPSSVFENLWKTIKQKKAFHITLKNRKKCGDHYWVDSRIEPEFDSDGKHIGYIATRFDITDRKEVEQLHEEIAETQREVIFRMGEIGETRSKETGNHVRRVAEYSKLLALYSGLSEDEAELIKQASPMHDIGKVGIPDAILNKPGKLDAEEWIIMQTHAQIGHDMLMDSSRPLLKAAAIVAYEHHEKYDGSGYPQGLSGENIHIYGRITAVADVFDALGSERCYKKAWDEEKIFNLFKDEKGKHFDPKLIDIFFDNLDEFLAIRDKFNDY
ncbi:LytS/YhcK type 5TM receptor domain-containing protein [Psychrosphaera aquimarina]|uniref:LytS/YhcK type 5TM receptor domain-containing protein n=1 Tax=Psychrosphaera aquimarina TaxID=2044854 RepID=A0ABU3QYQ5_9GAMM|nr:LytS/YhcK type 5TM receptor domain-containing protein [Psychrosphaera aquimarina]MDU0112280.1 LytS/YhcK type 5TM receptor domain-containing protein [Psychrosphaera aquimarina]